jgi:hypothetical protein
VAFGQRPAGLRGVGLQAILGLFVARAIPQ